MKRKNFYAPLLIAILASCQPGLEKNISKNTMLKYPNTRKDTTIQDNYFGTIVKDPYRWLEDDTSAETKNWVSAQNRVTRQFLEQIPFREAIKKRYETLFNYEKYSAPFREGKFMYYFKNSGLQNQSVLYREPTGGGPAEVFLDPNQFSPDGTTSLAGINFSRDGSLAAYQISEGGSDWRRVIVIQTADKKILDDTLENVKFSGLSWRNNEGFYYSSYDKPAEGSVLSGKTQLHKLYFHRLGTTQDKDQLIFGGNKTQRRYIGGSVTENQKWLVIWAANTTYGNELYLQDLTKPDAPIHLLTQDMKNRHSVVTADDAFLYIQTDKDAPTNRIVTAPLSKPESKNWITLIEAKPEVLEAEPNGGYLFCSYLKDAITRVYQYNRKGIMIREVNLPGPGTAGAFSGKEEDRDLYYVFTSYLYPATIFRLDMNTGSAGIYKKPEVRFDPEAYETKQVFYSSKDGTRIPMILTYKKGLRLNGKNPALLYGYGGFGASITPYFSTSRIILLENGGVLAVANLRGGGEYGEEWHRQGIRTRKQNVFDDFIAAAQYLIDSGYTSRDYLALEGGSNGGLLVGAVMTQKPDLCKVVLPAVGVLDMLRYHKFTAGAGWSYDYGTSEESKEMFEYLKGYSPLHNLKEGISYPATMVTTADHDDRVVPAHSFKFTATLQEKNGGDNPVLIRIETRAGHGAGQSTQQIIEQESDKWSFMFYNMNLVPKYKALP